MALTPKQEAFACAYVETGNASEAYRRAGMVYDTFSRPSGAYVYFLVREDTGQIVYVGKGRGRRMFHHMRDFRTGRVSGAKKHEGIRKLSEAGVAIDPKWAFDGMNDPQALELEAHMINRIGRGKLLNAMNYRGHPMRRALEQAVAYKNRLHPSHKGDPMYREVVAEFDEVIAICKAKLTEAGLDASA